MPITPFPPGAPTISGRNLTVDVFLKNAPFVQRAIEDLTLNRFLADVIFTAGPATESGAVLYDQVLTNYMFLTRDAQDIRPGSEFPILNGDEQLPSVAIVKKWGGEVMLTDEVVRRDRRDLLNREMTRLRNTIVRRVDAVAVAALLAAPTNTIAAATAWSSPSADFIGDLATAVQAAKALDLGYEPDTCLLNPVHTTEMLKSSEIRTALPRERTDTMIYTGQLGRMMGLDFFESNRVPTASPIVLQRKMVGGISDEVPLYARPIRDERKETTFLHGARVVTPYVTDPKCVTTITGV